MRTLPRLSRNMMAGIADFNPIPQVLWTNILPGKRLDRLASGPEMLRKRYEALARLSRSLVAGTPEDWIRDLNADLRGMLPFDLLEVVVYKKDENEIEWRSTEQTAGKDIPLDETLFGCVYQHQQPLWIADFDADEGCGGASQRLKNLELGYRSFCGVPLSTPYRRLGVFGLASLQPDRFTAEDVAFLIQVAGQLALAIDNRLAHDHIADLQNRVAQESVSIEEEIRGETHFQGMICLDLL
jgi:GAF domain-containing protein